MSTIDLSQLPPPDVVEALDYDTLLQAIKADFAQRAPDYAQVLETPSDPVVKLLESAAYVALMMRQRINDAAQSVMLAHATGSHLDHLAALLGVARQVVVAGQPDTVPPQEPVMESDDDLRRRTQLALEGYTTAGSVGAYRYWALSAHGDIKDVQVQSLSPGQVTVTILTCEATTDEQILQAVREQLEDKRPLTDHVIVQEATLVDVTIAAQLVIQSGPDADVVRQVAKQALDDYLAQQCCLGQGLPLSGLYAALHQAGVAQVNLLQPPDDITLAPHEALHCTAIELT